MQLRCRDRMPDYTGKTFGEWKAISKHPTKPGIWLCECKCGRKCNVSGTALPPAVQRVASHVLGVPKIGVQGRTFGQLEVEERARDKWRCRCKLCGRTTKVSITGLRCRLVTGGGCRRCNSGQFIAGPGRKRAGSVNRQSEPNSIQPTEQRSRKHGPARDDLASEKTSSAIIGGRGMKLILSLER